MFHINLMTWQETVKSVVADHNLKFAWTFKSGLALVSLQDYFDE